MNIALDIGTSRLRSLRRDHEELVARSVPAAFALIADEPSARELLTRADIDFAEGDGELLLIGDGGLAHAAAFRSPPVRLMPGGLVPTDDPPARQLLGTLIESLLPEPPAAGSLCGLIVPAAAAADKASREFLSRLVWMRGYEPVLIAPSHAIALATLSPEGFTGVTLSLGAGDCTLGLVHRGQEVVSVSEPRGTDWIDAQLAVADRSYIHDATGERYLDTETIRRRREGLSSSIARPNNEFASRVGDCCRELLGATLTAFAQQLGAERHGPFAGPLPMICTGGGTRAAGFTSLMTNLVATTELPIDIEPVRLAPPDEYLVARGGLIHVELESTCEAAA